MNITITQPDAISTSESASPSKPLPADTSVPSDGIPAASTSARAMAYALKRGPACPDSGCTRTTKSAAALDGDTRLSFVAWRTPLM